MTYSRHHRSDGNQSPIVEALRKTGHQVISLSQVGNGVPDLLCARGGTWFMLEVKMPGEGLRAEQVIFFNEARGPVALVHSTQEAIDASNKIISGKWKNKAEG